MRKGGSARIGVGLEGDVVGVLNAGSAGGPVGGCPDVVGCGPPGCVNAGIAGGFPTTVRGGVNGGSVGAACVTGVADFGGEIGAGVVACVGGGAAFGGAVASREEVSKDGEGRVMGAANTMRGREGAWESAEDIDRSCPGREYKLRK